MEDDYSVKVCMPSCCVDELTYICQWLFGDVFGVSLELSFVDDRRGIEITSSEANAQSVSLDASFFYQADDAWLQEESMGEYREVKAAGYSENIPCIYGEALGSGEWIEERGTELVCGIDILGSIFFLISRYEECVTEACDDHGRFSSEHSIIPQQVVSTRAIGNELIELLWQLLKQVFPKLTRKPRKFRTLPSHDIDHPSYFATRSWIKVAKSTLKMTCKEKNLAIPWRHVSAFLQRLKGDYRLDPWQTHEWIMDQSEAVGTISSFYYIPECTDSVRDGDVNLEHAQVRSQLRAIHARGHEVGVHPGYATMENPELILRGVERLKRVMAEEGIDQNTIGGRQHYLKWHMPETANAWDKAGLDYDSSLGFADRAGFRCGLCYEYPLYDVISRKALNLRERPLILMECSVIDPRYEGLGTGNEAFQRMMELKNECRKYHGDFTILWHNTRFDNSREKRLYQKILRG